MNLFNLIVEAFSRKSMKTIQVQLSDLQRDKMIARLDKSLAVLDDLTAKIGADCLSKEDLDRAKEHFKDQSWKQKP